MGRGGKGGDSFPSRLSSSPSLAGPVVGGVHSGPSFPLSPVGGGEGGRASPGYHAARSMGLGGCSGSPTKTSPREEGTHTKCAKGRPKKKRMRGGKGGNKKGERELEGMEGPQGEGGRGRGGRGRWERGLPRSHLSLPPFNSNPPSLCLSSPPPSSILSPKKKKRPPPGGRKNPPDPISRNQSPTGVVGVVHTLWPGVKSYDP